MSGPTSPERLLSVSGLEVDYGGIRAVRGLSLHVEEGQVVALLGSNGAGKTTTMNAIMGLIPARAEEISCCGVDVAGSPAHQRFRSGLALVPEGRGIVVGFTVEENLKLGHVAGRVGPKLDDIYELFPRLHERLQQAAESLSGGEQQMLALARALLSGPRVLLLDEPTMGLAPIVIDRFFEVLRVLRERGTAMLIAEQSALQALDLADYAYLLQRGRIVAEGAPQDLGGEMRIIESYLDAPSVAPTLSDGDN